MAYSHQAISLLMRCCLAQFRPSCDGNLPPHSPAGDHSGMNALSFSVVVKVTVVVVVLVSLLLDLRLLVLRLLDLRLLSVVVVVVGLVVVVVIRLLDLRLLSFVVVVVFSVVVVVVAQVHWLHCGFLGSDTGGATGFPPQCFLAEHLTQRVAVLGSLSQEQAFCGM